MNITREEYQRVVFLCNCVYKKLAYPDDMNFKGSVDKLSGFKAEVFEYKEVDYIVFSGTDFTSLRDWMTNIKMAVGIKSRQFSDALEFVLQNYNQNKKTIFCGHSMGGSLAEYSVSNVNHDNVFCVTLNGAGIKHMCKPNHTENVYHFITDRDILNRIMNHMPFNYFKHVGHITVIVDKKYWNGVKSHSNFRAFMKYKKEEVC